MKTFSQTSNGGRSPPQPSPEVSSDTCSPVSGEATSLRTVLSLWQVKHELEIPCSSPGEGPTIPELVQPTIVKITMTSMMVNDITNLFIFYLIPRAIEPFIATCYLFGQRITIRPKKQFINSLFSIVSHGCLGLEALVHIDRGIISPTAHAESNAVGIITEHLK